MATIILAAAGAAAGASLGGGVLGLSSVVIGRAIGATVGRVIDQAIMGSGSDPVETGRVDRFRLTSAGAGSPIAQIHGRMRIGAQVIWASDFVEEVSRSGGGGKGQPRQPEIREYSYSISLALGLCEGVIGRVGRVWADGREIDPTTLDLRVYDGAPDQQPDPLIEAHEGQGQVPAYRGLAYVVIENLQLGDFGNRVPQFTFEVIRTEQDSTDKNLVDMSEQVQAVAMLPGTGEYVLATTPVRLGAAEGEDAYINVNTPLGKTDFAVSLDALTGELPRCGATSLIVSWFGSDLRCGTCDIRPKVEQTAIDGKEMKWRAGGIARSQAQPVARSDGRVVYGGTPADGSVIEAIRAMNDAGQKVMFYPFILMDQLDGNTLPDPYSDSPSQPALPWRGRITLDQAPGRPGSPDGTAGADAQVAAFFGDAQADDFSTSKGRIVFDGPDGWGYRRFILHNAHLCALAGGVDAFCIGSEMRGLTTIRGAAGFPAVAALRQLAADVRAILGPDTKISYAADWTEYFGYQPQDGSGDLYFHLDPLWADANIDFIGIDNYMPLSDWRDQPDEADAAYGAIYNLDYLKANILGGEGYDWYYPSPEAEALQIRAPITDGAHGEPWVYRYKDLTNWWRLSHHERIGGERQNTPTPWIAQSKPIWFTELGCAAIDKGTNQPNKFLDPKSSESGLPKYSDGSRDDFMQLQYLRAMHEFWGDTANNPVSVQYGGPMVDMGRAHVWAWDARPYPWFPGNPDLWDDAENYNRGHWITGRATSRALAAVVREICGRSGVSELDTDALFGVLRGYTITEIGDARRALQPLMLAFGFDAIERGGKLVFRSRTGDPDHALDAERVAVTDDLDGDIVAVRAPDAERVGRLKITFVGADGDFETQSAEAIFPDARSHGLSQSELPILLSRGEAREIAERWLAEARVARDRLRFALPPSDLPVGAGDVVDIKDGRYRVDHVEQGEMQLIDAVRIESSVYDPARRVEGPIEMPRYRAPTPPVIVFLDLPILAVDAKPHAPYIAASGRPWDGSVNVLSLPERADYRLNTVIDAPTTLGVTENSMLAARPSLPDRGPALRVRLLRGDLSAISQAALFAGANAMAIGRDDSDTWEIFQFRDAQLVAPRTYDLSYRLRGQLGTDGVMPAIWPEGSRVVLLDRQLRQIDMNLNERGLEKSYLIGPAAKPSSDPSYVETTRAFDGIGLRPFAPVHLRARRQDGDVRLDWIRRTRIDGDSWQGVDVPLGEDVESYTIRVLQAGAQVRSAQSSAPRWVYSAVDQAADGIGGTFDVEVAQNSVSFGPGLFRRLTVTV
ncbi:glycoside hydrolase/phage tail family protein [Maribius pontilimi]|uniref:Glycoside hydrolase/phage tail family protein n=1 Tax=Palleronia pontilimi TaxID=1964209 RepID=A0A934IFQ4_9RHOB|nr:glycoside hydrolase/phage tail family protein [Palleronia pontilimi]MBJ3761936.1 glycoside hydrolase/phage tail family protein [Palleronia pontilimi]